MRVSIFTPKAFSMRSAMSPERSALPLSRLDRAGRDTCSAAAAAVTDRPAGAIISVRMKSPGWGGFFMGMAFPSSVLVIVFQIHVVDFALRAVDAKRQTPVAGDAQAPGSLAVPGQRVNFPVGERTQLLGDLHVIEKCQHLTDLFHRIRGHTFRAVFLVELFQTLVDEVPYFHRRNCSL